MHHDGAGKGIKGKEGKGLVSDFREGVSFLIYFLFFPGVIDGPRSGKRATEKEKKTCVRVNTAEPHGVFCHTLWPRV